MFRHPRTNVWESDEGSSVEVKMPSRMIYAE
jgi:hypothetical protein